MEVYLSIYFIDHLNKKIKLDENIVDIEEGIFDIQIDKIYNSLTFVVRDIYISPDIVGDFIDRVELRYKTDVEISEYFVIDSIEYLINNNIKVYCKSKSIKYTYSELNTTIEADNVTDLITSLMPDIVINSTIDIPLIFDYSIEDKTVEDVIKDLSSITLFEYYYYRGVLYIEYKKIIQADDIAIQKFTSLSDIMDFSTSNNNDNKKITKIFINENDTDDLIAAPLINLEIKDTPQCCSPDEVIIYTDDSGNTYKISPVNATFLVYFSPTIQNPICNIPYQVGDRIVVEDYILTNDNYVRVTAGINEIIAITGVENYTFKKGYNLLVFDNVVSGELKITYKTTVLYGSITHNKYPKQVTFNITHFNQAINYIHNIELNGYYPIPYNFTLNLMKDWGLDYDKSINQTITITKKNDNVFVNIATTTSNAFGEATFDISEYGTYKFEIENEENLYLDWYINSKKIYMDEVQ